MTDKRENET